MSTLKVGEIKHESFTGTTQLKLDSAGRRLVGTTTEGHDNADDLTIATSGQTGITIRSASNQAGNIYFSDATSGGGESDGFISYSQSVNKMFFGVNQETRMLIDSSGNVGIGTSTINRGSHSKTLTVSNTGTGARSAVEIEGNTANAHGVLEFYNNGTLVSGLNSRGSDRLQFVTGSSGTVRGQFTSNGLNFGSDTAAANAISDYEEGTFTPTNTIGMTLTNNNTARYTKIGRMVYIQLDVSFSGANDVSQCGMIQSLPFTSASNSDTGIGTHGALQFISEGTNSGGTNKLDHDDNNTLLKIGSSESRIDILNVSNGTLQTRAYLHGRRFRISMWYTAT